MFLNNLHSPRSKGPNRALLKLEPLQPVKRDFAFILDKEIIKSSSIKDLIYKGDIKKVNSFLGRPFKLSGISSLSSGII